MKTLTTLSKNVMNTSQMSLIKGGASYAVYYDGQLCCFIKAASQSDADAWARSTYGKGASAVEER